MKVKLKLAKSKHVQCEPVKPNNKVRLTFYLNGPEAQQLRIMCENEDISVSYKIRQHVRQLLQ